ncbi:diguanylate cyclase (GGDEF)-like protein [Sphingobium sp. B11D3B]|nr:diguanylate cyclase (GGDEF)-like protein [Sphingobium sp. B11D3B]
MIERVFDASPLALCILDPTLRIIMANQAARDILKAKRADMSKASVLDILPAAAGLLQNCLDLARKGSGLPDRRVTWQAAQYHLSFGVTRDVGGNVTELFVAALDVTRRARIERQSRDARRRLVATSRRDHLTGLLNRRGFDAVLHREVRRARRDGTALSLVSIDIDWFKAYNDTLGHPEGDRCLRLVACALLASSPRAADSASRFGGEEFILILPNTDLQGALAVAEKCRLALDGLDIPHPGSPKGRVTVSIGVCTSPANWELRDDAAALMEKADRTLYQAKHRGRDRIEVAEAH